MDHPGKRSVQACPASPLTNLSLRQQLVNFVNPDSQSNYSCLPSRDTIHALHTSIESLLSTAVASVNDNPSASCSQLSSFSEHHHDPRPVYELLPMIMHRIFGFEEEGWLEIVAEHPAAHREALIDLVGPQGPIFRFLETYEKTFRYEFMLHNLPDGVQKRVHTLLNVNSTDPAKQFTQDQQSQKAQQNATLTLPHSPLTTLDSVLAKFCAARAHIAPNPVLYLNCLEYYLFCLVLSSNWKSQSMASNTPAGRKSRRSSNLPTRHALYIELVFRFLHYFFPFTNLPNQNDSTFSPSQNSKAPFYPKRSLPQPYGHLFLKLILDCWLNPALATPNQSHTNTYFQPCSYNNASSSSFFNVFTTPILIDSVAMVIVHFRPIQPADDPLYFRSTFQLNAFPSHQNTAIQATLNPLLQPLDPKDASNAVDMALARGAVDEAIRRYFNFFYDGEQAFNPFLDRSSNPNQAWFAGFSNSSSANQGNVHLKSLIRILTAMICYLAPWSQHARKIIIEKTLPNKSSKKSDDGKRQKASASYTPGNYDPYHTVSVSKALHAAQDIAESTIGQVSASLAAVGEGIEGVVDGLREAPMLIFEQEKQQEKLDAHGWNSFIDARASIISLWLPAVAKKAARARCGVSDEAMKVITLLSTIMHNTDIWQGVAASTSAYFQRGYSEDAISSLIDLCRQIDEWSHTYASAAAAAAANTIPIARKPSGQNILAPLCTAMGIPLSLLPKSNYHYLIDAWRIPDFKFWFDLSNTDRNRPTFDLRKSLEPQGSQQQVIDQVRTGKRKFTNRDIPFFGSPWDIPLCSYESPAVVYFAYSLSRLLADNFNININLRFMASYYFISFIFILSFISWVYFG